MNIKRLLTYFLNALNNPDVAGATPPTAPTQTPRITDRHPGVDSGFYGLSSK